jgi:hypothetical protein
MTASITARLSRDRKVVLGLAALVAVAGALTVLLVAVPGTQAKQGIGDHSFVGRWAFGADGQIEHDGAPGRAFWEAATFTVDGKGHMTGGKEYSNLISDDPTVIDHPFTFEGTYHVNPDGTGRADVDVTLPNGAVISKAVWFVLSDMRGGEAYGFVGGHTHAELGEHVDGNAGLHVGRRID